MIDVWFIEFVKLVGVSSIKFIGYSCRRHKFDIASDKIYAKVGIILLWTKTFTIL